MDNSDEVDSDEADENTKSVTDDKSYRQNSDERNNSHLDDVWWETAHRYRQEQMLQENPKQLTLICPQSSNDQDEVEISNQPNTRNESSEHEIPCSNADASELHLADPVSVQLHQNSHENNLDDLNINACPDELENLSTTPERIPNRFHVHNGALPDQPPQQCQNLDSPQGRTARRSILFDPNPLSESPVICLQDDDSSDFQNSQQSSTSKSDEIGDDQGSSSSTFHQNMFVDEQSNHSEGQIINLPNENLVNNANNNVAENPEENLLNNEDLVNVSGTDDTSIVTTNNGTTTSSEYDRHYKFSDTSLSVTSKESRRSASSALATYAEGELSADKITTPKISYRLDGLMIAGETWNIVTIDGTVHFFNLFMVSSEPAMHYKGLPHAIEANYRYEIPFAIVDNCTLSLLITSNVNRNTNKGKGRNPVVYKEMCNTFQNIIRQSMKTSQTMSWMAHQASGGTSIAIKQEDWEIIGNLVADRLRNFNCQVEVNSDNEEDAESNLTLRNANNIQCRVFPDSAKFCFLLKKFGHDMPFESTMYPNPYPHVQINHNSTTRVIVHVAHDYTMETELLFFNKKFVKHLYQQLNVLPTHQYNIGIIPRVNNYLYLTLPFNDFNVSGMQQYTRLFNEVHRNCYEFFRHSVIARAMLNGYVSKLNQNLLWLRDPILTALRKGILKTIENGILEMMSASRPVAARCEFVWSLPLHQQSDTRFSSIIDVLQKAFHDCSQFKQHYEMCENDFFIVHNRRVIMRYLRNLTRTLFDTLSYNLTRLQSIFLVKDEEEIYDASVVFTDKDFADIVVSEAMLTRLLRGDMCGFPNLMEGCVLMKKDVFENEYQQLEHTREIPNCSTIAQEEHEAEDILRSCWPFKKDFVWRSNSGLLRTSIHITKVFREFPDILGGREQGQHMITLARSFDAWKRTYKGSNVTKIEEVTIQLFRTLANALLQRLLAINADSAISNIRREGVNPRAADNERALQNIWNYGQIRADQRTVVKFSVSIYKTVSEDTSNIVYKKLAPLIFFMNLLRNKISDRFDGGTQRSLAMAMDELMLSSKNPFMYRLPQRTVMTVFIPITFQSFHQAYVQMYNRGFYSVHKKKIGERGIHVERFMEALVDHISSIPQDHRDEMNASKIFQFINKLLDTTRIASDTELFKAVPSDLRYVLFNVTRGVFAMPTTPIRKPKSIHQELVVPEKHDNTKMCLRSSVQKDKEEKARKEEEQKALEAEALRKRNEAFIEQFFIDCLPPQNEGFNTDAFDDASQRNGEALPVDQCSQEICIVEEYSDVVSNAESDVRPTRKQYRRMIRSDSESDTESWLDDSTHSANLSTEPNRRVDTPRPKAPKHKNPRKRVFTLDSDDDEFNCLNAQDFQPFLQPCAVHADNQNSPHIPYRHISLTADSDSDDSRISQCLNTNNSQRSKTSSNSNRSTARRILFEALPKNSNIDDRYESNSMSSLQSRKFNTYSSSSRFSSSSYQFVNRMVSHENESIEGPSFYRDSLNDSSESLQSCQINHYTSPRLRVKNASSSSNSSVNPQWLHVDTPRTANLFAFTDSDGSLFSYEQNLFNSELASDSIRSTSLPSSERSVQAVCQVGSRKSESSDSSTDDTICSKPSSTSIISRTSNSTTRSVIMRRDPEINYISPPTLSCASSTDNSLISGGFLFRNNKRKHTGTPYDGMEFAEMLIGNVSCPKQTRKPPLSSRRRRPFLPEEDFKVFNFLSQHNYMLYMFGNNVHKLISKLGIVDRSYVSLQTRISKIARFPDLADYIGKNLAREVRIALRAIRSTKHTNVITIAELEHKHNVKLD